MSTRRLLLPALALLITGACSHEERSTRPPDRPSVIIGMAIPQATNVIDSVYWYMGVRPDTVMSQNGMLRVVLPGDTFGHRVRVTRTGCKFGAAPPLGALRSVAMHAWSGRDSSIHRDTVQVVVPMIPDTLRRRWWLGEMHLSCGPGSFVAMIDASRFAAASSSGRGS